MKAKYTFFVLLLAMLAGCHNNPFRERPVDPEIAASGSEKPDLKLPWKVIKGARIAVRSPLNVHDVFFLEIRL